MGTGNTRAPKNTRMRPAPPVMAAAPTRSIGAPDLQRSADSSPVVASLKALQREADLRAGGGPVQRVLSYEAAVSADEIVTVTVLKQGAVFQIAGALAPQRVIIKIEPFQVGEGKAAYAARHEATTAIARAILGGAPGVQPLSEADFKELMKVPDGANGAAREMKDTLKKTIRGNFMAFKAEHVDVGVSLQELFDSDLNARKGTDDDRATMRGTLENPAAIRQMGKMATLDLLVGNQDRLNWEIGINLANMDFVDNATPVPIDNVDPNGLRLEPDAWNQGAGLSLQNDMGRQAFARRVHGRIYHANPNIGTGIAKPDNEAEFVAEFVQGMVNGINSLKAQTRNALKAIGTTKGNPARRTARDELNRRVGLLH